LLVLSLAVVAFAMAAHLRSNFARSLADSKPVSIVMLTNPPAVLLYDPVSGKVSLRPVQESGAAQASTAARISSALESAGIESPADGRILYFIPSGDRERQVAWDTLKRWLNDWRYDPRLALEFFAGYVSARLDGDCNIRFCDFLALTMEATRLEVADFMISSSPGQDGQPNAPRNDKPLVVEVLNASGQKGAGAIVTKYLRELNEHGTQKIDVIRFDNYRVDEARSRFMDHTGRMDDVRMLAQNMGLASAEVVEQKDRIPVADVTLIVGVDYLKVLDGWKTQEMIH